MSTSLNKKKNIKNEHENRHHLLCCNICTRLFHSLCSLIFYFNLFWPGVKLVWSWLMQIRQKNRVYFMNKLLPSEPEIQLDDHHLKRKKKINQIYERRQIRIKPFILLWQHMQGLRLLLASTKYRKIFISTWFRNILFDTTNLAKKCHKVYHIKRTKKIEE